MRDLEKTIGHLFYTTSSIVHHLKAISGFYEIWCQETPIKAQKYHRNKGHLKDSSI